MNYFNYIKRKLPLYLISGVVMALSLFSLLMAHSYNNQLADTLGKIRDIRLKKDLLKKDIDKTDALIRYIRHDLDADMAQANPEGSMFRTLDDMKANLQDATISVSRFDGSGNNNELPVEIEAGMKNYKMVLEYVAYVESFIIPDFEIRRLAVSKGQSGGMVLKIEGVLAVPASDTQT
ncbi:MAG: hypothetical protein HZC49_01780 [Nitrospirae bacterium]|nr:hypothetical protein [Nitrospirota bacterium]